MINNRFIMDLLDQLCVHTRGCTRLAAKGFAQTECAARHAESVFPADAELVCIPDPVAVILLHVFPLSSRTCPQEAETLLQ